MPKNNTEKLKEFISNIEESIKAEQKMVDTSDKGINAFKKVKDNAVKRRVCFRKMLTALKKGNIKRADQIYRGEMPKPIQLAD